MSTGNRSQRMFTDVLLGGVIVLDKGRHVVRRAQLRQDIISLRNQRIRASRARIE